MENGTLHVPNGVPAAWQLRETANTLRATASAVWIDGAPARGGILARLHQVRDSIVGAHYAPVLVVLEAELPPNKVTRFIPHPARNLLQHFLAAQYDLTAQIRRFAEVKQR